MCISGAGRCSIRRSRRLRLTDIELAVESEAAFGLLGAAARAAMPHLQKALAEKATIDLKPFAANAQKKIAAVIADFQKNEDGVRVSAEISKPAARRHRLRFQNAARDRRGRRRDQRLREARCRRCERF